MIRIILDKVEGIYTIDILDTRDNSRLNISRFKSFLEAATTATLAIGKWQEGEKNEDRK